MNPRDILKKIRQIELRTNRIVNEALAGESLQTPEEFVRIPGAVENGNNREDIILVCEVNAVCLKSLEANGLVFTVRGKGTYVAAVSRDDFVRPRASFASAASIAMIAAGVVAIAYLAVETNNYFAQPGDMPVASRAIAAAQPMEYEAPAPITNAALVASAGPSAC